MQDSALQRVSTLAGHFTAFRQEQRRQEHSIDFDAPSLQRYAPSTLHSCAAGIAAEASTSRERKRERERASARSCRLPSQAVHLSAMVQRRLLEHDNWENRAKMKELMRQPLFVPQYDLDLREEREQVHTCNAAGLSWRQRLTSVRVRQAYKKLQAVVTSGLVSIKDFRHNPLNIFAAHEILGG